MSLNRKSPQVLRVGVRALAIASISLRGWRTIGSRYGSNKQETLSQTGWCKKCLDNVSGHYYILDKKNLHPSKLFILTNYLYVEVVEKYLIFSIIFCIFIKIEKTNGGLIVSSPTNMI